jgi:hypothetical protein
MCQLYGTLGEKFGLYRERQQGLNLSSPQLAKLLFLQNIGIYNHFMAQGSKR